MSSDFERLVDRFVALEESHRLLKIWVEELAADLAAARLPELGPALEALHATDRHLAASQVVDRRAIVASLVAEIRGDPRLRELLRGPQGIPGLDGEPGPPGDAGSTVIRERIISG